MKALNKILVKLGIYDLMAVLFTGIIICTLTVLIVNVLKWNYLLSMFDLKSEIFELNNSLTFLVISYFIGLIFQEIGSFVQKHIVNRNNSLLKKALKVSDNSYMFMTAKERDSVFEHISSKIDCIVNNDQQNCLEKYNINMVYNYCKHYVMKNIDTSRIDRDQSLSAMARSLYVYFFIMFITTSISFFYCYFSGVLNMMYLIVSVITIFIALLMYNRSCRFAIIRYTYIFRAFYYYAVYPQDNDKIDNSDNLTSVED